MDFDKRVERLKAWEREARPVHSDFDDEAERKATEVSVAYYQRELQEERAALVRAERAKRDAEIRSVPSAMALAFAKAKAK